MYKVGLIREVSIGLTGKHSSASDQLEKIFCINIVRLKASVTVAMKDTQFTVHEDNRTL